MSLVLFPPRFFVLARYSLHVVKTRRSLSGKAWSLIVYPFTPGLACLICLSNGNMNAAGSSNMEPMFNHCTV